ncbi:hypothetical protein [Sporosarcina highlanderae]|uniref:C2H2-type domain-containing protein n=1 Tax=Sporosarcina highlanderae TaxID=3035916 RepID=A0ABT8JVF1_9BACL|nr:hypothetical protein [Sporosarcina highlanderae]MDN4609158.1 hypothetical protein [Sporosarcina highlanderae]
MIQHPQIGQAYAHDEPKVFDRCVSCDAEIHEGADYIEHAGLPHCNAECLIDQMIDEGHAEVKVAGDDTVRVVRGCSGE